MRRERDRDGRETGGERPSEVTRGTVLNIGGNGGGEGWCVEVEGV